MTTVDLIGKGHDGGGPKQYIGAWVHVTIATSIRVWAQAECVSDDDYKTVADRIMRRRLSGRFADYDIEYGKIERDQPPGDPAGG
ncbi:MAG: hypothetical protein AMJ84_13335 [Acidithiobacillales bacterium SM23_46]|nr:MAG: hypothetical protein AMJ84_13335 [Acidithiobacillales bacterium SM23_46]